MPRPGPATRPMTPVGKASAHESALTPPSVAADARPDGPRRARHRKPRPPAARRGRRLPARQALTALAAFLAIAVTVLTAADAPVLSTPSALPPPPPLPSSAASSASAAGGQAASGPASSVASDGWKLAFSTDFPGTQLDTATWDQCYPWTPSPPGCTNFGNADEREWYLPSQVQVENGKLALTAQRTPTEGADVNGKPKAYTCRSGMVTTYDSFSFKYGIAQVTARLPFGKGLWPAIWFIPADGSWPPEIDVVEHWDTRPTASATLHYGKQNLQQRGTVPFPQADQGWHTYTLYWTPTRITVYYDDTLALTTTADIPQQPMYLLLDLANENDAPGSCDGTMYVKSVNIWDQP
jgi:beta-glucanase (GH16 family)